MSKIDKENFGYLGLDYQTRLISQFLTDERFATNIMDIVNPNYFEDETLRIIVSEIKEAYETDEIIPDASSLEFRLVEKTSNEFTLGFIKTQIKKIREAYLKDSPKVQKIAMNFCKQQELKKSMRQIQKIIDKGNLEDYDQCEEILKKALEIGDNKDDAIDVFDNLEDVLALDFRKPIPTGINGLDEVMDGGLSKTELAIILAPLGVGKTTIMTKMANSAHRHGMNVLQIFFEDNPKVIQRKHLTCWMDGKYTLNQLSENEEEILQNAREKQKEGGRIQLKKFTSHDTTMTTIKNYVRKEIARGFKPDIIFLDYIDCVIPSKRVDDVNVGEGVVMREFEAMLFELNIAGWTAVQSNRSGLNADTVDATMMGGSIKKAQIGHFVLSIAKGLEQKDNDVATMAILKSRFGNDGKVFEDILFKNSTVEIDITTQNIGRTVLETRDIKKNNDQQRVNFMLDAMNKLKDDE